MENEKLTRDHLETLSFSELVGLACQYGIDVPEDLDYNFLIGELLEVSESFASRKSQSEMTVSEKKDDSPDEIKLPVSYNLTEVQLMMRNPAWGYVYWNISEADYRAISKNPSFQLLLRICSFSEKDQIKPDDSFNIQISLEDNEQYILLPAGSRYYRVDLLFSIGISVDIVASSNVLCVPSGTEILNDYVPGKKFKMSPAVELSGMNELLSEHYKNHRESFS